MVGRRGGVGVGDGRGRGWFGVQCREEENLFGMDFLGLKNCPISCLRIGKDG